MKPAGRKEAGHCPSGYGRRWDMRKIKNGRERWKSKNLSWDWRERKPVLV
jgi:hypothetical protein